VAILYPEVRAFYLVDFFRSLGSCLQTGMGLVPLTWQEIESWQRQNGIELKVWEVKALKIASAAHVSQVSLSTDPNCPPPNKAVDIKPEQLDKKIKSILR
jgi:hypothetical protein